jgi:hypothetical protein
MTVPKSIPNHLLESYYHSPQALLFLLLLRELFIQPDFEEEEVRIGAS